MLLVVLLALAVVVGLLWQRNRALTTKYGPIIDVQAAAQRTREEAERHHATAKAEVDRLRSEAARAVEELQRQKSSLSQEYAAARELYDRLKREVGLLEENIEDISVGLYKPHYHYDSSEQYKKALEAIREQQKGLVKGGKAAVCGKAWRIENDQRAGERMTKQYLKLILRAFNGECDAAVARVSWNNITRMEERIRKAQEAINVLGGVMDMKIMPDYLELKLAELRLEYETDRKRHEEQEEQRRIREQMREEERALREAEKARQDAEEEEARQLKALERARADLAKATGESLELLQRRIQQLDAALHKAQELKEKATSMAQLTRSGHVYVVSNVGSFGENIFKIGMTRRLEPMDRIRELGDASVPFEFDVHAMVYSQDAPTLERELQTRFQASAVNLVNPRKEFFEVSLDHIQAFAREKGLNVELTKLAEAREYRETLAKRADAAQRVTPAEAAQPEFPRSV